MDSSKVLADFQLMGNRVSRFSIETNSLVNKGNNAIISYDIDYNIIKTINEEDRYIGLMEFIINADAKIKDENLFNVNMVMEGLFVGNPKRFNQEQFINMLELNGVATLSQLSRAYIISMSSISGLNPPVKLPMLNIHNLIDLKHNIT